MRRQDGLDDLFDHRLGQISVADLGMMLGRQHDGVDLGGLAIDILDGDLRLGVGTQPRDLAAVTQLGLALHQTMRQVQGQRHQLFGLVDRIAEHQALVAGALVQVQALAFIHTLSDVGRLCVVSDQHGATLVVDAIVGVVVTDALDDTTRHRVIVDLGFGGDLTSQHDQTRVAQGLSGNARVLVLSQDGIEDGIGNLIGNFVRMSFGNRLRRKQVAMAHGAGPAVLLLRSGQK